MAKIAGISSKTDTQVKNVPIANKIVASDINILVTTINTNDDELIKEIDDRKKAISNVSTIGAITYQTKTLLLAVSPTPSEGTSAIVANDSDNDNNGGYSVVSGAWVQNEAGLSNITDNDEIKKQGNGLVLSDRPKATGNERGYFLPSINFVFNTSNLAAYANTIIEIRYNFDFLTNTVSMPDNVTLDFKGGSFSNGILTGLSTSILNNGNKIFNISNITFSGTFKTVVNPYMFGIDNVNNTTSLQRSISASDEMSVNLEWIGNFKSSTVTVNKQVELYTKCVIQSVDDLDLIIIDGLNNGSYTATTPIIKHSGSLTLIGTSRIGVSKGLTLRNGVLASSFDKIYIKSFALGIKYDSVGNNNIVSWNFVDIRFCGQFATTTFTKGAVSSPNNVYDIGEITTALPLNTSMGFITVENKLYPIVEKPSSTNVYFVGGFSSLLNGGAIIHYTGGGIHHADHTDNGAIEYKTVNMFNVAVSYSIQSFYGITVGGGELEGCSTHIAIGGLRINTTDNVTPNIIYSIRSSFYGLHTEANTANQPLVFSLKNSYITFNGCLIRDGVRVNGAEIGVSINSSGAGIAKTNVYHITAGSPTIIPTDPMFVIYRDLTVNRNTAIKLQNLTNLINYTGQPLIKYTEKGELNMLNVPAGQTRQLTISVSGTNTLNGGTSDIVFNITGVAGKTIYKIAFLLVGNDYKYYIE